VLLQELVDPEQTQDLVQIVHIQVLHHSLDFVGELALVVTSEHLLLLLEAVEVLLLLARALRRRHRLLLLLLSCLRLLNLGRLPIFGLRHWPSRRLRRWYFPHMGFLLRFEEEVAESKDGFFAFIREVAFLVFLVELVKVAGG